LFTPKQNSEDHLEGGSPSKELEISMGGDSDSVDCPILVDGETQETLELDIRASAPG